MQSKIPRTNDRFHIILKTPSQFKVMETGKKAWKRNVDDEIVKGGVVTGLSVLSGIWFGFTEI